MVVVAVVVVVVVFGFVLFFILLVLAGSLLCWMQRSICSQVIKIMFVCKICSEKYSISFLLPEFFVHF